MIPIAIALLQASSPAPITEGSPETEVVVVGKRLAAWRGKASTTFGITTCKTTRSTGDREIDGIGCKALTDCWSEYRARIVAARKQQGGADGEQTAAVEAEAGRCLKTTRDRLVDELVARRDKRPG